MNASTIDCNTGANACTISETAGINGDKACTMRTIASATIWAILVNTFPTISTIGVNAEIIAAAPSLNAVMTGGRTEIIELSACPKAVTNGAA